VHLSRHALGASARSPEEEGRRAVEPVRSVHTG